MSRNIKSGLKWLTIEKLFLQISKFIFFIVLARALSPEEFGVVAISGILIGLGDSFLSSGFTHAYIRDSDDDKELKFNSLIAINILFGALFTFLVFTLSPYVGEWYESGEVTSCLQVLCFNLVFNSLASTLRANNDKSLLFGFTSFCNVLAIVLSYIISLLYMWYEGASYWVLVVQTLIHKSLYTLFLMFRSYRHIRPRYGVSKKIIQLYVAFGWKLQVATVITFLSKDITTLILGKYAGLNMASLYSRANNLQVLVSQIVIQIVDRIAFPVMSKVKSENDKLILIAEKTNLFLSTILAPTVFCLFIYSESIIYTLFGPQWMDASPLLRILSIHGFFRYMQSVNLNVLKVKGYTSYIMYLRIFEALSILSISYSLIAYGVNTLVYGLLILNFLICLILNFQVNKVIGFSIYKQVSSVIPVLAINFALSLSLSIFLSLIFIDKQISFFAYVFFFPICYFLILLTFKNEPALEVKKWLISLANRARSRS